MNLEDGDDVYNWPFLYLVRAGNSELTDEQIPKLRDLNRRVLVGFEQVFWNQ